MNDVTIIQSGGTTTVKVDDAVGVPKAKENDWFVAVVNNRSEKKYAQLLESRGYNIFIPIQKERRIWKNGAKKTVDRVLISSVIFIHCSEKERLEIVHMPFVKRFMVDHTKRKVDGRFPIARIPNYQIENFRRYIEHTDDPIEIEAIPYKFGDKVKVVRGKFEGLEGNVVQYTDGKANVVICIGFLGCAKLNIDLRYIKHI